MSTQLPDLSRRKLVRMASYSSLVLLGGGCCTKHEPEMHRVIGAGIPGDCQTQKSCGGVPVDTDKLFAVSKILWTKFLAGAHPAEPEEGVFQRAYEMSGPFVICNLDKFPTNGDDVDTGNCSVECGKRAAALAGHGKITVTHFETAWCAVQKDMNQKLARLPANSSGPTGGMGCG